MQWFIDKHVDRNAIAKVLDVGSYNVNGCYRELFNNDNFRYSGLDMEKGPNVDIIPKSSYIWEEIKDDEYDVVISGQAFEHIEFFWVTFEEIVRVTKEGGLICIIAPNGFSEHRYPVDCWRFFTDGMVALARYFELELVHAHTNAGPDIDMSDWFSSNEADSMLIARKNYSGHARRIDLREYKCKPSNHREIGDDFYTYSEHLEKLNEEQEKKGVERSTTKKINGLQFKFKGKLKKLSLIFSRFGGEKQ